MQSSYHSEARSCGRDCSYSTFLDRKFVQCHLIRPNYVSLVLKIWGRSAHWLRLRHLFFRFWNFGYSRVRLEDIVNNCSAWKKTSHANCKAYAVSGHSIQSHSDSSPSVERRKAAARFTGRCVRKRAVSGEYGRLVLYVYKNCSLLLAKFSSLGMFTIELRSNRSWSIMNRIGSEWYRVGSGRMAEFEVELSA